MPSNHPAVHVALLLVRATHLRRRPNPSTGPACALSPRSPLTSAPLPQPQGLTHRRNRLRRHLTLVAPHRARLRRHPPARPPPRRALRRRLHVLLHQRARVPLLPPPQRHIQGREGRPARTSHDKGLRRGVEGGGGECGG